MSPSRVVIFPYGLPATREHQERCADYYLKMGGDSSRVIDGPFANIERACAYVQRIGLIVEGRERPIVIFTRTNPLVLAIVGARRKMETLVPQLRDASWALLVDPRVDPFFRENARRIGTLVSKPESSTIWRGPDREEYGIIHGGEGEL